MEIGKLRSIASFQNSSAKSGKPITLIEDAVIQSEERMNELESTET